MRVVIVAGGTGGHFYPGLSVARELLASQHQVSFIIREGDFVRPLLEREKIPFMTIPAAGLKRSLSLKNLAVPFKLLHGLSLAYGLLSKEKPVVVLVMGGYLSVAPAIAAKLLGIPVVLHEQNRLPGLANRLLARLATRVAVSFEESVMAFGDKAVVTGNPVRAEFFNLPAPTQARKKWGLDLTKRTILIFGGSLGARRLNQLVLDALRQLAEWAPQFQFLHITGPADAMTVKAAYEKLPFSHYVDSYCHDMASAYAASDLVICRSGASTISELAVVKRPAILVPYPHATDDHQTANAKILESWNVARVYQEKELESSGFMPVLREAFENAGMWEARSRGYSERGFDFTQSAKKVAL